jgi:hypothetical protein
MPFDSEQYDSHTADLMTAALQTACMAARLAGPDLSYEHLRAMEAAIVHAVARGLRSFTQLQQIALDAIGAETLRPVERRQHIQLVDTDRRKSRRS